ncbi:two-component system chemotaxis response regulator CheB [Sphaerotilus sulfidivorans]|uniref:Protein-glutamate methylesterase/protein-glutamine glutaminase n=1 Tax=Sphaerotilus sulfidivorans TaxID=639200 RepID=A0A5C1Q7K9_9BURK|nr:chemotaxis-specific protein-glutamate methyltransferase CheB [Sphaerotilus sulfidivorans]NZD47348.1 chemotaxis-specific protein-glutamate methyltransferase CheB [Sphaerotilus sulfidivorans]QEN02886.1 chemotaxis-specific protein-glutamate methyltransferase CheB [Sphaerotilus sulfidivorans]
MPGKVLVVDDSALMRRLLSAVLTQAGWTVAAARNGREGVEQLLEWQPDVVTLDINMPEMDGLTALSLMMQARPTPIVMVSSLTEKGAQATMEALALGAVDFIAKPGGTISLSIDDIQALLLEKVRTASRIRLRPGRPAAAMPAPVQRAPRPALARPAPASPRTTTSAPASASPAPPRGGMGRCPGLVLIGISTGGPRTLEDVLPQLPADFPWPVLVAQHMPPNFTLAFAQRMDRMCALEVVEVGEPMPLEPGRIHIGRGGTDLVVVERLGRLVAQPRPESPAHPWHPSADVMVESAMRVLPASQLVGVLMTGMGFDGARAMAELKARGGRTIAEAESSCVVFGMPSELIQRGGASVVLPSQDVARQLRTWVQRLG